MEKLCCVCQSKDLMLYSRKLEMGWCRAHMPKKDDYRLALKGAKDPRELCNPN